MKIDLYLELYKYPSYKNLIFAAAFLTKCFITKVGRIGWVVINGIICDAAHKARTYIPQYHAVLHFTPKMKMNKMYSIFIALLDDL